MGWVNKQTNLRCQSDIHLKQNTDVTIFSHYVTTSSLRLGKIKAGNLTTNSPHLSLVVCGMLIIPEKWSEKKTQTIVYSLLLEWKHAANPQKKQRFFASFQVHQFCFTAPLSPKRRYVSSINAWASKRNMCSLVQLNTMEMSHKPMSRYKCSKDNIEMIIFKQQILHTTFPPNKKNHRKLGNWPCRCQPMISEAPMATWLLCLL